MDVELASRTSSRSHLKKSKCSKLVVIWNTLPRATGLLVLVFFPTCHMLLFKYLWGREKPPVDRVSCNCSCWDTVFKGPYETGIARYKHFYFNSTSNTFKIWIVCMLGVVSLYEALKSLVSIGLERKLRWRFAILFLVSIFSNYYAWWGVINYYNDEFYKQWYHQLFFTVSEIVTTGAVLSQVDRRRPVNPRGLLLIANIALCHIILGSKDQFVFNILLRQGKLHQVGRDLGMMSTDLVHLGAALLELRSYSKSVQGPSSLLRITRKNYKFLIATNSILVLGELFLL